METLILTITETMNLFSVDQNKKPSFNIGSVKATSKEAPSIFLHAIVTGNKPREEFLEKCSSNLRSFEERVKKQKIQKILILHSLTKIRQWK